MAEPQPLEFELVARRVKVKSNGTTHGTQVVTVAEDGTEETLLGVVSVAWSAALDARGEHDLARAIVTFEGVEADVVGVDPDA